jgi:hypothetical protein
MKILMKALFGFGLICLFLTGINAQTAVKTTEISAPKNYQAIVPENSPQLQALLNRAVGEMLNSYPPRGFKADDISAVLIDLRDAKNLRSANFRGDLPIYPASVVKMFLYGGFDAADRGRKNQIHAGTRTRVERYDR